MRMLAPLVTVIAICMAQTPLAAEPATPSQRLCKLDKFQRTNPWVDCLNNSIDKSQKDLDTVEMKIAAAMKTRDMLDEPKRSENIALFKESQRNWRAARDSDCKSFAANRAGLGFGAVQVRLVCLLDETVAHLEMLNRRYREELR